MDINLNNKKIFILVIFSIISLILLLHFCFYIKNFIIYLHRNYKIKQINKKKPVITDNCNNYVIFENISNKNNN